MNIKISYNPKFIELIKSLRKKYTENLFNIEGIGNQLDINGFSKKLFSTKITATNSIDANSNITEFTPSTYINEMSKPFLKLNSYYLLWNMLGFLYNNDIANDIIENQLAGDIYINDFHGIASGQSYSYYGNSVIILKHRKKIKYINMKDLFELFKNDVEILKDHYQINLKEKNIYVLDKNGYTRLLFVIKHKNNNPMYKLETKTGFTTIITDNHPVILGDTTEKNASRLTSEDSLLINQNKIPLLNKKYVNKDYAYFIGFLLGDGNVTVRGKTKNNNYRHGIISIRQNNISDTKIFKVCSTLFKHINVNKKKDVISIYNRDLAQELKYFSKLSFDKKLPMDILEWKTDAILSLIGGIFDSDGTVNKNAGVIDIRVNAFALIQQLAEIMRGLNFDKVRTSLIGTYKHDKSYKTNYALYRLSFAPPKSLIKFSEKIKNNKTHIFKQKKKDGRWKTNKLHKIIKTNLTNLSPDEYVYDITTTSGHFHCQGMIQHNCYNFSTLDIVNKGLPMINKIKTIPPKYLYSFKSQLEQFVSYASNSIAGAAGIADMLVSMSWFVEKILETKSDAGVRFQTEKDCWKYVEENLVSFIYTVNQPFRAGIQASFTNISLYDDYFLESMKLDFIFPDKRKINKRIVKNLQLLFLDIINKELERTPITFPVTTACFSVEDGEIQDKEFLKQISEKNLKYGFINIYCGKSSTLSSCCRLRSDTDNPYFNSFGAGKNKLGSCGVCSINLPKLAWKCKGDKELFKKELYNLTEMSARVNNAKRHIIKKRIMKGFLPLYSLGFMDLSTQYSTTGLVGISECLNICGTNILTPGGQTFVKEMLEIINKENERFQNKFDAPHNVEQVPSENLAIKLAEKDKELGFNKKYDLYSNQFIPLTMNADMLDRIIVQGMFDKEFSGGAIVHLNIEQQLKDPKKLEELIKYSAKTGVIYFAVNYNLQKCEKEHLTVGRGKSCSICKSLIVDNFTRVVGFLTNVKNWPTVRRTRDYPYRKFY